MNVQGEEQKKLDVISNDVLKNALRSSGESPAQPTPSSFLPCYPPSILPPPPCCGLVLVPNILFTACSLAGLRPVGTRNQASSA